MPEFSRFVELETCEISTPECRGYKFCHYRPYPRFLLFLSFRLLRCRLVSLTSVLEDSVSAADSSFNKPPWCVCLVLMSSLSELLEVYGPIPRGAVSPDAPLSAHHYPWVPYPGMTRVLWCPLILILTLPSSLP